MASRSVGNMIVPPGKETNIETNIGAIDAIPDILYAKVVENTTNEDDNLYQNSTSYKTIYFKFLPGNEYFSEAGGVAGPLSSTISNPPVLNEIVLIIPNKTRKGNFVYYYIGPVNLYNNGSYNTHIDTTLNLDENDNVVMGKGVNEDNLKKVRNLIPAPGDFLLEGRFGNTIRMGNSNAQTDFSGPENSPITIIRNGQKKLENDTLDYINEDINEDCSSIYLTCNQTIPINVSSNNLQTFGIETKETITSDNTSTQNFDTTDLGKTDYETLIVNDSNDSLDDTDTQQTESEESSKEVSEKTTSDQAFVKEGSSEQISSESTSDPTFT